MYKYKKLTVCKSIVMSQEDTTLFETVGVRSGPSGDPRGPNVRVYTFTYHPKGSPPGTPPEFEGLNVTVVVLPATLYFFDSSYFEVSIGGVVIVRVLSDTPSITLQEGYSCSTHVLPGIPDRRLIIEDTVKSITYNFDYSRLRNRASPAEPIFSNANALIVTSPSTGGTVSSSNTDVQPVPSGSTPVLSMQGKHYLFANNAEFSPTIRISSVSAGRCKNFGEMFTTVTNTQKYTQDVYDKPVLTSPGVWETQFCQFPQFNSVLKGKGYTLEQKFLSIIEHYNLTTTLDAFTGQMALYAYTRFILSRFLFGDFDVCYLTQEYTREFFERLAESEFKEFVVVFGPDYGLAGFDKYFKRTCDRC